MYRNDTHNHSIGTSLMTHGLQGIDTHHKTSSLIEEAESYQLASGLRASSGPSLRRRIGGMMITLGAAIAGKTHDLQERQATKPSPSTARSGFVPTR